MNKNENNLNQTVDLLLGVIPTLILYGNFIFIGLIFGIKDLFRLNNPFDEIFLISLGGLLGLLGLVLSFGKTTKKVYATVTSILIICGLFTAIYVIYSLYTEPDSPDTLYEKLVLIPLFGSILVGIKRLYLSLFSS